MATLVPATRHDRALAYIRALCLVIVPFLLVAFVLLNFFPSETMHLFAWTIKPTMTPMVRGSAYLGGAYCFLRVLSEILWDRDHLTLFCIEPGCTAWPTYSSPTLTY